ncbi:MAG: hypothetical protein KKF67_00555 [Nanoarchaeota archaeon]|nr:hypothetical protein [Nanoarchaeota archaeon]
MKPSLQFYIDVSGQPKGTVFVGMLCVQSREITPVLKTIRRKYPWFFHRRSKGSGLKINQIQSIIALLNGMKVRMICVKFSSKEWNNLIEYCGKNRPYNIERIFSALYFQALRKYSYRNNSYPLTVCLETFMDIDKVINYLRKISSANKVNYQVSKTQTKYNDVLKLADVVAAGGKKSLEKNKYDFFDVLPADIDTLKYYLRKIK